MDVFVCKNSIHVKFVTTLLNIIIKNVKNDMILANIQDDDNK